MQQGNMNWINNKKELLLEFNWPHVVYRYMYIYRQIVFLYNNITLPGFHVHCFYIACKGRYVMHVKFQTHKQFMSPYVSIRFFMHCYVSWAFSQLSHPRLHLSLCLRLLSEGYLINNIVFCFVLWSSICGQLCWNVFVRGAKNIYFSYSWPQDAYRNKQCHL